MIHNIEPRIFKNNFSNRKATATDLVLAYDGDRVLVKEDKDKLWYPSFEDFKADYPDLIKEATYLFFIVYRIY